MSVVTANFGQKPPTVDQQILALHGAGFTLIPLGGPDGKKPQVRGWHSMKLGLTTVTKRMQVAGSRTYGIRLDGLLVVDLDTDNEATRRYVDEAFPSTPFIVKTGRGEHRYYRHKGPTPKAIRTDDIAIDFKAGSSAFVVGPGSVRPDGKTYRATRDDINVEELPLFREYRTPLAPVGGGKVPEGIRNKALYQRAVEYAPMAEAFDDLLGDLTALRDIEFDDAASVPDSEIMQVAEWAWGLRLEGRLWVGRNSTVQINRMAIDYFGSIRNGGDACLLYNVLLANHGHHPGKEFAIVPDAMIEAGLISMPRARLYRAREFLIEAKFVDLVRSSYRGAKGWVPDQFRLVSPSVAAALRYSATGGGGRVSKITLMTNTGHTISAPSDGAA